MVAETGRRMQGSKGSFPEGSEMRQLRLVHVDIDGAPRERPALQSQRRGRGEGATAQGVPELKLQKDEKRGPKKPRL